MLNKKILLSLSFLIFYSMDGIASHSNTEWGTPPDTLSTCHRLLGSPDIHSTTAVAGYIVGLANIALTLQLTLYNTTPSSDGDTFLKLQFISHALDYLTLGDASKLEDDDAQVSTTFLLKGTLLNGLGCFVNLLKIYILINATHLAPQDMLYVFMATLVTHALYSAFSAGLFANELIPDISGCLRRRGRSPLYHPVV